MSKIHVDAGRLLLNEELSSGGYGLNVGCGKTHYHNKINVDLSAVKSEPELLASALDLPFRDGCFQEIFFTEVIEHLPPGSEVKALRELSRILGPGGQIVLSTPNKTLLAILLDPMFYLIRHRHYKIWDLLAFARSAGLVHVRAFTAGRLPFGQPTLAYALNFVLMRKKFDLAAGLCARAFKQPCGLAGSTVFIVLRKSL